MCFVVFIRLVFEVSGPLIILHRAWLWLYLAKINLFSHVYYHTFSKPWTGSKHCCHSFLGFKQFYCYSITCFITFHQAKGSIWLKVHRNIDINIFYKLKSWFKTNHHWNANVTWSWVINTYTPAVYSNYSKLFESIRTL